MTCGHVARTSLSSHTLQHTHMHPPQWESPLTCLPSWPNYLEAPKEKEVPSLISSSYVSFLAHHCISQDLSLSRMIVLILQGKLHTLPKPALIYILQQTNFSISVYFSQTVTIESFITPSMDICNPIKNLL